MKENGVEEVQKYYTHNHTHKTRNLNKLINYNSIIFLNLITRIVLNLLTVSLILTQI
jgi:hypothetical protein